MENEELAIIDITDIEDQQLVIIQAEKLLEDAGDNLSKRGKAINEVCQLLYDLHDKVQADTNIGYLSKKFKVTKKIFNERLKDLRDSEKEVEKVIPTLNFPPGINELLARKKGFFDHNNCYWFLTKDEGLYRCSNFTIKPLFHIYSKTDNKRLIEITNEYKKCKILDVPSKCFVSVELFQQIIYNEGNYLFFGAKIQFMKLIEDISNEFPTANELKTLGWQREGFYAFANGIFNGCFIPVDDFGITEHNKQKYFSPAFSSVYNTVREDDDTYENDRYFIWQKSPVEFEQWSKLMMQVYGEKAMIAMAFLIACVLRDLIYEKYKMFPHLFLFGEKQSGKSQLAWSLSNVFFNNLPAFNLNSGTQVGFFRRLSRVKNGLVWLDEYTNDIDEKRHQAAKSAYDGVGHEKGMATKDNRTEVTKINSGVCISGQYLPTRDDNALLTRSILLSFEKKKYTDDEIKYYADLKELEIKGLSSLIGDILHFRDEIDSSYGMTYSEILDQLKGEMIKENKAFDERLIRNYVSILTPVKIILKSNSALQLNFTYEDLYKLSKESIADMSIQISSSESLANFWKMVEYLLDQKEIKDKEDFEIKTVRELTYENRKSEKKVEKFDKPFVGLFIRFSKIHPMYMEAHRRQTGKNGIDLVSLMHYIKNHISYKGYLNSHRFSNSVSSCYCFDYENMKDINLTRIYDPDTEKDSSKTNSTAESADDDLPF